MKVKKYFKKVMFVLITVLSIGTLTTVVKADTKGFAYRAFRDNNSNIRWKINTGNFSINAGKFIAPDGTIAYCIEPNLHALDVTEGNYDINNNYSSFSSITGLDFDKIRELSLISFYGYGYNGDISDENYLATQLEMWNAVSPNCCSIESGDASIVNSKRSTIRGHVNNEITRPSFHKTTQEVIVGTDATFSDINGVLNGYEVTGCNNCNASISGNILKVIGNNIGTAQVNIKRVVGNSNQGDILYTSGSYQKLMTFNQPDPMTSYINLKVKGGILKIQKKDKDNKSTIPSGEATLEGAIYEIYDENKNVVTQITTDANGKAQVELPLGNYTIKEVTAPKGYMLDEKEYEFNFDKNNLEVNLDLEEKVIDGYGLITKEYGDDEVGFKLEENAKFEVINYLNEVVGIITTDEEGIGIIKLPYGTYILHQIEGMDKYAFVDDIKFTINETQKNYKFRLKNLSYPRVDIVKLDIDTNDTVEGAIIELYKYNNETNNFDLYYEGTTDKDGKLHIQSLELGKYYYIEKEAPEGYLLDSNKYYFELTEYGKTYKFNLKDEKIKGTLEFSKVDFSTNEALPNTLIEIYNENDKLVFIGRTDENGKIIIQDLPYGKYYILEKEAPEGYQLNIEKMWFEILENGQVVKTEMKDEKIVIKVPDTLKNNYLRTVAMVILIIGIGMVIYGLLAGRKK